MNSRQSTNLGTHLSYGAGISALTCNVSNDKKTPQENSSPRPSACSGRSERGYLNKGSDNSRRYNLWAGSGDCDAANKRFTFRSEETANTSSVNRLNLKAASFLSILCCNYVFVSTISRRKYSSAHLVQQRGALIPEWFGVKVRYSEIKEMLSYTVNTL